MVRKKGSMLWRKNNMDRCVHRQANIVTALVRAKAWGSTGGWVDQYGK